MKTTFVIACAALAAAACAAPTGSGQSSYVGQETREIKALSADEIQGLLAGKGLGYAKPAELNGYPGPMHVLELADQLELSTEQRVRTHALFTAMRLRAMQHGRELVDEERRLESLFATRAIDAPGLAATLKRIGSLQAEVRASHLEAHLAQAAILTPDQLTRYTRLRGYLGGSHSHRH